MHTIIRKSLAKVLVIGLMPLFVVGCQKEGGGSMQLIAESFGGTKAAVDGVNSYWVDGETVRINGVNKRVNVENTTAYVTEVEEADYYRALYPGTLNSSAALNTDEVSVLIPRTYTYRESDGLQRLGAPMAACGTGSSRLYFQHLTAALTVEIKNIYGFTIEVDSVVVESNKYQLCGEKEITLSNEITVDANISDSATDKKVKVTFDGGTSLQILAGQTRCVQVPVLPVGDDNRFTIKVGIHKVDDSTMQCIFNRTQGDGMTSYAMERNQMGFAGVTFGKAFSVSATKKVILAQGNLQYVPSTGVWSFHSHQYDVCESPINPTSRYIANGTLPIDLFGYGTSGYNNMFPYMTSVTDGDYKAPITRLDTTEYDWGWHNAISNGGKTARLWHTLSADYWTYIFFTRDVTTVGINDNKDTRYTYATINGTHLGIILFPDEYTHPDGVSLGTATFNNYSNYTASVSYEGWAKMEAAGAVFLPATSYRDGESITNIIYGMYWTSSSSNTTRAYRIWFYSGDIPKINNTTGYRHYGMSVRLAKDL